MAGRLFSPLINRFRRSDMNYDSERLLENNTEIPLGNLSAETADLSILRHRDQTSTSDEYLQDARVSNENTATKVTVIAPSLSSRTRKIFHFLGVTLAIFSTLLLSVSSLLFKLAESIPSLEIVSTGLTLQLVFSLPERRTSSFIRGRKRDFLSSVV